VGGDCSKPIAPCKLSPSRYQTQAGTSTSRGYLVEHLVQQPSELEQQQHFDTDGGFDNIVDANTFGMSSSRPS
jgi:hypothetical protein